MSAAKPASRRQGNRTKASEVEVVPSAMPDIPPLPEGLESVAEIWLQVWSESGPVYSPSWDRHIVEQFCRMTMEVRELEAVLSPPGKKSTYTTKGSTGQLVIHPLRKQLDDLRASRLRLMRELGMTPDARAKLGISVGKAKNALDEFMAEED